MKQYEKIYFPKENGPYTINTSWGNFDTELAESEKNVIVLTIEELREAFKEGYNEGKLYEESADDAFKSYLTSKGITI